MRTISANKQINLVNFSKMSTAGKEKIKNELRAAVEKKIAESADEGDCKCERKYLLSAKIVVNLRAKPIVMEEFSVELEKLKVGI